MTTPLRVIDVLDRTAKTHATRPAFRIKKNGTWETTDWQSYRDQVRRAAKGMIALGLAPGDCVTIIGANSPEWFLADIGAIAAGGIPAGIYATNTAEQCQYIAHHCDATIAFVQNAEQLAKFRAARSQLPSLRAVVQMEGTPDGKDAHSWQQMLAAGESVTDAQLEARLAAQKPDDVCTLIYTSGTTGAPKAVMISHDNITWTASMAGAEIDMSTNDELISYLPLSHIAEQIVGLHGPMAFGSCSWFAESMETLGDTLREARPHIFLGVPRVWEKIQEKMEAAGAKNPPIKKKIVRWARGKGLAGGYAAQQGAGMPMFYGLANKLVFSKVRKQLGLDRARMLVTSAAPIGKSTLEFFLSLGLPICEVYGMSECTGPATMSLPNKLRTGKAGFCPPGAELRIAEDGEICMRGRHVFKGYFKDPASTAETLDNEGWLHSGDIGEVDRDGFLQITDRKKEIIITAGGENVAPQFVEGHLKSIPVVSQAVVVGDRRRYLSVLLTLDPAKIAAAAAQCGSTAGDPQSASRDERFLAYLQKEIDSVNQKLARVQTVKKFSVIPRELTEASGVLTPTMKVKRKVVLQKFADLVERMYQ